MFIIENKYSAFQILGLNNGCSADDVKKAFKNLSLKFHPDKGGNNDHFIKIKTAYDICLKLTSQNKTKKMDNVSQKLILSLAEAYNGCSKFLNFSANKRCCNKRCTCGLVNCNHRIFDFNCKKRCQRGFFHDTKKVEIKIPPKTFSKTITLEGLGNQAIFEDEVDGDLIIDVEVKDDVFEILPNGDLLTNIVIDWKYALAGQEILLNHPKGEIKMKTWDYGIIQNNDEFYFDGYGTGENEKSKLIIRFQVVKPEKPLSETIRKMILNYLHINNHIVAPKFN